MNWEEYTNSDWYRESHQNEFNTYKPSPEQQRITLMRECLSSIEGHRDSVKEFEYDGEVYNSDEYEIVDGELMHVTYLCKRLWNGRYRGFIKNGTFEECVMARYDFNVANIGNEWEWASVEKVLYHDREELDDILCGYMDDAMEIEIYGDYDYDEY